MRITSHLNWRQPEVCQSADECASACVDNDNPEACLWIAIAVEQSRTYSLQEDELLAMVVKQCAKRPDLCSYLPGEHPDLDHCDESHPDWCLAHLDHAEDLEGDEPQSEALQRALSVALKTCDAGYVSYCDKLHELIGWRDDGPSPLESPLRGSLRKACDAGDPNGCLKLLDYLARERGNGDDPDEEERRLIKRGKELRVRDCRERGDWLSCRRAGEPWQVQMSDLLRAFHERRCAGRNQDSCSEARKLRLALAAMGAQSGKYETEIDSFERECFREKRSDSCVDAGRTLLSTQGDAGLPRARKLLAHACGKGGCEVLAIYLFCRSGEVPAFSAEVDEWRKRGCSAGESALCPLGSGGGDGGYWINVGDFKSELCSEFER